MNPTLKKLRAGRRIRRKAQTPCLSELIAWHMERRSWDSNTFAQKSGLNASIISRILNFRQTECSPKTIERIARTIGCEPAKVWEAQRCSHHLTVNATRNNGAKWSQP